MSDVPSRFGNGFAEAMPSLVALEAVWAEAAEGESLLHGDLRLDNMLVTKSGVQVVDWPNVCIGAPWVDLVLMLPSLATLGVDVEPILNQHPLLADVDDESIDAVICALTGYFVSSSLSPPPPGLPTVREFQAKQCEAGIRMLARRPSLGVRFD